MGRRLVGCRLGSRLVAEICRARRRSWILISRHLVFVAGMGVVGVVGGDVQRSFERCFGVGDGMELAFAVAELGAVWPDSVQLPLDQGH